MTAKNRENSLFDMLPQHLIAYECKKYKSKGWGLLFAWVMALMYFFGFPILLQKIWPEKVESEGKFYTLTTYAIANGIVIFVNLEYLVIYKLELPFFERYKTTPDPWPWQVDKQKWNSQIKKAIIRVAFNNGLLMPIFLLPDLLSDNCPLRLDPKSIPNYFEIFWQMCFCMFIEDFTFYLSHRLLHTRYFYSKIHKIHHEFVEPVCISATYAHFVEYILGNLLPSAIPPLILGERMHFLTYIVYISMVLHETHEGHSGYTFPWSPHRVMPLTFDAEFHIFHHWKYTGNYANYLSIWDRVFGTLNKPYMEYFKNKEKYIKEYKRIAESDTHLKEDENLKED